MVDITEELEKKRPQIDKIIEKYVPRKLDAKNVEYVCGKPRYGYDTAAMQKAMNEPIWDLLDRGGKRWRPALYLIVAEAIGAKAKDVEDILPLIEVVHNGTLVHDDIEDNSDFRRGKPCTHKKFGLDVAINVGDGMYFLPTLTLIKNRSRFKPEQVVRAWEAWGQEMLNLCYGQSMDIWWHRGNADNITEEQYLQMCAYKTGTLARMAARLGVVFAGGTVEQETALGRLAEAVGVAFQIRDDILNIATELEPSKYNVDIGAQRMSNIGKEFCEDIKEGKRTLMVVHTLAVATPEDRKRLVEILNMHASDPFILAEGQAIIKKYKAIEYAQGVARNMLMAAWAEADKLLKPSPARDQLKALADYLVVERKV